MTALRRVTGFALRQAAEAWRTLSAAQKALLLALLCAGALFRAAPLERPMLYDETFTYQVFVRPGLVHALARYDYPNNHILHSALVWASTRLGRDEALIRLPAFAFSLGGLCLFFLFARRYFGATAALFALFLLALSTHHIDYGHNARGYSMNVFFTLLAACGIFEVAAGRAEGGKKGWALYALGSALSMYTVPTTLYFTAAVVLFVPFHAWRLGKAEGPRFLRTAVLVHLLIVAAVVVLYLPPIAFLLKYPDRAWMLHTGHAENILAAFPGFVAYLFSPFGGGSAWLPWGLALLALAGAAVAARKNKSFTFLLYSIVLVPFLMIGAGRSPAFERNVLYVQPFIFLGIGALIAALVDLVPAPQRLLRAVCLCCAVVLAGIPGLKGGIDLLRTPPDLGPQQAALLLNERVGAGDGLFMEYGVDNLVRYYLSQRNEDKYREMFALRREGALDERMARQFGSIYLVTGSDAPALETLAKIYGFDPAQVRACYRPPELVRRIGSVRIYRAERVK